MGQRRGRCKTLRGTTRGRHLHFANTALAKWHGRHASLLPGSPVADNGALPKAHRLQRPRDHVHGNYKRDFREGRLATVATDDGQSRCNNAHQHDGRRSVDIPSSEYGATLINDNCRHHTSANTSVECQLGKTNVPSGARTSLPGGQRASVKQNVPSVETMLQTPRDMLFKNIIGQAIPNGDDSTVSTWPVVTPLTPETAHFGSGKV